MFHVSTHVNGIYTHKNARIQSQGSEEIETTCITDTLTRFGAHVTVASVMDTNTIQMSRGITILADVSMEQAAKEDWDMIVLPGGMPGAEHLRDSRPLTELLQKHTASHKPYGAICASPAVALASQGLIPEGAAATCYPSPKFRALLSNAQDHAVVTTGNLVTSQGPGTSIQFALTLGEMIFGKEKRDEVAKAMLVE